MASHNFDDSNDLTTDACPSPPRENEPAPNLQSESKASSPDSSYQRNRKKKPRNRQIPSQAVANVININNSNGIHIGSNYTINMGKVQKAEEEETESEIVQTEEICQLLGRKDPLKKDVASFVAEHVGRNWRVLARTLGYSEGQIHQYYEKYLTIGINEVVYQILLDWIQSKPDDATVGALFTALWHAPEKDVVQRMAHEIKPKKL